MYVERKAASFGASKYLVLLGIVEVRHRQPRVVFPERSQWHPFRVTLERSQVVLGARHKRNVFDTAARSEGRKHITHESAVDTYVFRFRLAHHPSTEENVRWIDAVEFYASRISV